MSRKRKLTPLGTSPRAREGGLVDVEFGFAEASRGDRPRRVGHLLEGGLGGDERVDEAAQRRVRAGRVLVDDGLEDERGVARPCVEVIGARGARAGDHNARLQGSAISVGANIGRGRKVLALAPLDLAPLGPMFARTPAFAIGDSDATYVSALVVCARTVERMAARPTNTADRRMAAG